MLSVLLLFTLSFFCDAQNLDSPKEVLVSFKLKNNNLLPTKITMITYRPNENGNRTTGFLVGPYGTKTYQFPEGTKIYLANSDQVNTVMSGAKICDQPPFLVVKKEDEGKSFNIK